MPYGTATSSWVVKGFHGNLIKMEFAWGDVVRAGNDLPVLDESTVVSCRVLRLLMFSLASNNMSISYVQGRGWEGGQLGVTS